MCADCAYYNMKTHKCTRGCTGEPDIENGDDVRFFSDCPLPNVAEVRYGRWIICKDQHGVDNDNNNYAYFCSQCNYQDVHSKYAKVDFCWNCGADMRDGGADNE